ncbi:MAG: hypothetical protein IJD40_12480 [Lachnospiraceae bacterium]|nr:hypothetical protein [Lachnospiraceae bacterium]
MRQIHIGQEYAVNIDGTSDGTQDKYYKDGIWYKTDRFGGEGFNEYVASRILECTSIQNFVKYEEVEINGIAGCQSANFLADDEEYISIYRLHQNLIGTNIANLLYKMDFDDQYDYLSRFVKEETNLELSHVVGEIFFVDNLILNEDRHLNNIGFIYDGNKFRPAPIFDNGKSFFCGNKRYDASKTLKENMAQTKIQPFKLPRRLLLKKFPVEVSWDWDKVQSLLDELEYRPLHQEVLLTQIQPYMDKCGIK